MKDASIEKMERQNKNNYCFVIHTKTDDGIKDYILSAENEEVYNKWMSAVTAAIHLLNLKL